MTTRPETYAESPHATNHKQINFVNYTQYKFGWNVAQSSSSLCLIFIFTAIMPRILLPLLGIRRAIQYVCCASAVLQHRARLRRHSLCSASNPRTDPLHPHPRHKQQGLLPAFRRRLRAPRQRAAHGRCAPQLGGHCGRLCVPSCHPGGADQPGRQLDRLIEVPHKRIHVLTMYARPPTHGQNRCRPRRKAPSTVPPTRYARCRPPWGSRS